MGVRKTGTHNKSHFYNAVFLGTAVSYFTDNNHVKQASVLYFKDKETGSVMLN